MFFLVYLLSQVFASVRKNYELINVSAFLYLQENDVTQADKYAELAMTADRYNPAGERIAFFQNQSTFLRMAVVRLMTGQFELYIFNCCRNFFELNSKSEFILHIQQL